MAKKDTGKMDVEIDMTPMIDLVFLLIIFFIVVNDMSKTELEELKLPIAMEAGKDVPPPSRPILNVRWYPAGGVPKFVREYYRRYYQLEVPDDIEWCDVVWKKQVLFHPLWDPQGRVDPIRKTRADTWWKLSDVMKDVFVKGMPLVMDEKLKIELPDDPILIRADRNTPFKYVQRIMEVCTRDGIKIWKVQLAASEDPNKPKEK